MYLNLLVRTLDDPFDGPEQFHFKCCKFGVQNPAMVARTQNRAQHTP